MPPIAPAITLNPVTDSMLQHLVRCPRRRKRWRCAAGLCWPRLPAGRTRRSPRRSGCRKSPPGSGGARLRRPGSTGCRMPRERDGRPNMARRCGNASKSGSASNPRPTSGWTVRTLARDLGLPPATVHEVLSASGLQPHRVRTFPFSPDPDFEAKLLDIALPAGLSPAVSGNLQRDQCPLHSQPKGLRNSRASLKRPRRLADTGQIPKRRRRRRPSRRPANTVKN